MKRMMIALSLFFVMEMANLVSAQNINININLDKQPAWGPVGYDYVEYYYVPDLNIYYDVINSLFYYYSRGSWVSGQYLPSDYRKYDFYNLYKVVINERQPWLQNKAHKKAYSHYKGDKTQEPIRYSSNSRYNDSKNNNRKWVDANHNNGKPSNNQQSAHVNKNQDHKQNNKTPQSNSNRNNQSDNKNTKGNSGRR